MHLILLSGGSGYRLWPFSTPSCPKQFVKFLPASDTTKPNISMVQRIWKQLQEADLASQTIISTSVLQADLIKNQLGDTVPLVLEPCCLDTYPAILLSSLYLLSHNKISLDEVVIVMPVDCYVDGDFFTYLNLLESTLITSGANLALVGISPTSPSEKYGYIVPKKCSSQNTFPSFQKIERFVEKPTQEIAQLLLNDGALWNGGIFAFKLSFIYDYLKINTLPITFEEMLVHYVNLPKISFDYQVVEKATHMVVVPYAGTWKDLGTWESLCQEISAPIPAKIFSSSDCTNIHIFNTLDIPIVTLGVSDLVVAITANGILISDKEASSKLKDITFLKEGI